MNFSSVVALWATKCGVQSVLEVIAGGGPSACGGLVSRGIRVLVERDGEGGRDVRADMVVVHGRDPGAHDVSAWLTDLAQHASKLLVVEVPDHDRARGGLIGRVVSRMLARPDARPVWGTTAALAPILWSLGRVREHERTGRETHAFVVDVAPRTPQARRKVRLAGPQTEKGP